MNSPESQAKDERAWACPGTVDAQDISWGAVASDVPDPQPCIDRCQELFFRRVVPNYDRMNFSQVCERVSDDEDIKKRFSLLQELYCCDSALCGVFIEREGEDPNVNSIINRCQNPELGSFVVIDPGPPDHGSLCPADSVLGGQDRLPCQRMDKEPDDVGLNPITSVARNAPVPTSTTTSASSDISTSSEVAGLSDSETSPEEDSHGLRVGAKAAIIICSVLALLVVLVIFLCYACRRKSRRSHPQHCNHAPHRSYRAPGSPTPLISPTSSVTTEPGTPLTPPPRLRDRKLLPSPLSPGIGSFNGESLSMPGASPTPPHAISPAVSPMHDSSGFPQSPVCSPTAKSLRPRNEQSLRVQNGRSPPVSHVPGLAGIAAQLGKNASLSSTGSNRTTTASGYSTVTASVLLSPYPTAVLSPAAPPLIALPSRPPRPHDTPLEIPNLVRPDAFRNDIHDPVSSPGNSSPIPAPPPDRSLPCPPPGSSSSPSRGCEGARRETYAQHLSRQYGELGIATGLVLRNPMWGVELPQESKDLCEMTERYGLEPRHSWGSWGGGGPGTAAILFPQRFLKRGDEGVSSPVLREADLERMGGRY